MTLGKRKHTWLTTERKYVIFSEIPQKSIENGHCMIQTSGGNFGNMQNSCYIDTDHMLRDNALNLIKMAFNSGNLEELPVE